VRRNRSQALDLRITRRIQRIEGPRFDRLMHLVSWPGFPPQSGFCWGFPSRPSFSSWPGEQLASRRS
jgi:hypothetical protein